ncbi:unnamed protein product [Brassicogethes aeneus]|uniref:PID domain-containing protein n=1 Tax=Brassicogethes aeneus TaxID=1431903 RepID=A0A9P0FJ03_BRAAE|nr:unnamed protein product [Brassicogethes aeneus]
MIFKTFLNRLRLKKYASATISKPDPTYKVAYLGNVITGWAKGDGCVEKPLATLWRNYTHSSRPDVRMILAVSGGGLKATTKDHGLTEYWAHRLTTCAAPAQFPRLFCWVYRHEGRRLRHELRCHAVLCSTAALAKQIEAELKESLALALLEFKRDKISRQNARLSLVNSVYENPTIPRRKILLSTGQTNYRPPLERSKSAPKLTSIEELIEEEEEAPKKPRHPSRKLKHYDSASALLDKRKTVLESYSSRPQVFVPVTESCDEPAVKPREIKVTFNDEIVNISFDEKSDMILEELVQSSLSNDFLVSCERAWISALGETADCLPVDSDEGSLSSGCESASTVNSDAKQESAEESIVEAKPENKKTELDFKVGGSVLARVRSFERIANSDILKYCGLNTNMYSNKSMLAHEEVSLIPIGESQTDFSSLKVFKKKNSTERVANPFNVDEIDGNGSEEENGSACSDESGYEEEEITSSVSNIILV